VSHFSIFSPIKSILEAILSKRLEILQVNTPTPYSHRHLRYTGDEELVVKERKMHKDKREKQID
jgi:hypothetical protein